MIRPTVYGCIFPYRGPKNRIDISNILTSSKYDINLCRDFAAYLEERQKYIMDFYTSGETDESIKSSLVYNDESIKEISLDRMTKKIDTISNTITNLLFGGL